MRQGSCWKPGLVAALLAVACVRPTLADVLVLRNGERLDGRIVDLTPAEVVLEHWDEQAGAARTKFLRSEVRSIELEGAAPVTSTRTPPRPRHDYRELRDYRGSVILVLDRSGSMSIGDRFAAAVDEVDRIVSLLPDSTKVDVYLFDDKPTSFFEANRYRASKTVRAKVRAWMTSAGVNMEGGTDIAAALRPALLLAPDAIYLLTDGVTTKGEHEIDKIVAGIKFEMRAKKLPIHVVALSGGTFTGGDVEDGDGARATLQAIAKATGGRYREVRAEPQAPWIKRANPSLKTPDPDELAFSVGFHVVDPKGEARVGSSAPFRFTIEIDDPALTNGQTVREYTPDKSIHLDVRMLAGDGTVVDERKNVLLSIRGRTVSVVPEIVVTRGLANGVGALDQDPLSASSLNLVARSEGGSLLLVYRRAGREHRHSIPIVWVPEPAPTEPPAKARERPGAERPAHERRRAPEPRHGGS